MIRRRKILFLRIKLIGLGGLLIFVAQSCLSPEKRECPGIICPEDMACAPNGELICIPQGCGNGQIAAGEECDAGGVETVDCNLNCTATKCGDGIKNLAAGEECDDGNMVVFDGCDTTCHLEETCGNDRLDPGEECEKGRGNYETATCNFDCTLVKCDDQIINNAAGEVCIKEDPDRKKCAYGTENCQVCSSDCKAWIYQTGSYCGDGIINGPADAEQCDTIGIPEFCLGSCKCAPANKEINSEMDQLSEFKSTEAIVVDSKNGLVWQKKDDSDTYTWQEAKDYCGSLRLAGCSGWRMPTIEELKTLIDTSSSTYPFINKEAFPSSNFRYWTSTEYDTEFAWAVFFDTGLSDWNYKVSYHYIRCVR